jgi:glycosyltransferase involved in cell wall biosynthesis
VKVVFATPTLTQPHPASLEAMERSIPLVKAAGWDEAAVYEVGCPCISHARATMTRKALDAGADVIVYLDHDLSWDPDDLVTLLQTKGDVVAGTYRFKNDQEEYMGELSATYNGRPLVREDGAVKMHRIPAGFLKVTKEAISKFAWAYPHLLYGTSVDAPFIDLFNHGAHKGTWYGEDYAFSRNWIDCGGDLWVVPNLNITHHAGDKAYPGNYHEYLLRYRGGSNAPKESA